MNDPIGPDPTAANPTPLAPLTLLRLQQVQQFYHYVSHVTKQAADITIYPDDTLFREFLLAVYDSTTPVPPWKSRLKKERKAQLLLRLCFFLCILAV